MSITGFSMDFNGFSTKAGIFDIILNSASYFALRDQQFILIWILNVARRFFFSFDVIAESEDDKVTPSYILHVTGNFVFFRYHF